MKTKYGLNVIFHQFMKKSFHIAGCYSHLEDAVIETESSCPSAPHQISTTEIYFRKQFDYSASFNLVVIPVFENKKLYIIVLKGFELSAERFP